VEGLAVSGEKLFHYTQCGLDDVWLANGYHIETTEYGSGYVVENAIELHGVIARGIVDNPSPLRGQDARFLRTMLDLSQGDFGKLLGVDRTTVIRWEAANRKPLARITDIAIRETYASHSGGGLIADVIKELQQADDMKHGVVYRRSVYETRNRGWRQSEAA
jgi:putative transcriptional regulator